MITKLKKKWTGQLAMKIIHLEGLSLACKLTQKTTLKTTLYYFNKNVISSNSL